MEQVVELADLDEAQQVLSAAYGTMRIDGRRERSWVRMSSRALGPIRLDEVGGSIGIEVSGEPQSHYIFGYQGAGRLRYRADHEEHQVLPGGVFLTAQPHLPYSAVIDDLQALLLVVDESVVEGFAGGVRFTGCDNVSPVAAACWRSTCLHLRDQVLPAFAHEPLVVANATRLLVATTLATFPHVVAPLAGRSGSRALRRAISFIEANPASDITATDIAAAARVSIRALQLAFRRHLDTTPMAYLRRVRLAHAHLDLCEARGSVTTVAARWGYARPSVFAAHYRAAYGVSPSQTLWSR